MIDGPVIDGQKIARRLDQLAQITETPGLIARRYLTPEHKRANQLVSRWMVEAGMDVRTDAAGNLLGRYEAGEPGRPALMLGSHLDTVIDAGRFDGTLGVVAAIACVASLNTRGKRLPFAIEVVGFADEEGVRFNATLLGSRAVAGGFDPGLLSLTDANGVSMAEALRQFHGAALPIGEAARQRHELVGYIELHIEQGPVLEAAALAVGCVTAISGAARFSVSVEGMAGHAGTVPMAIRRDALAAAAECILAVESRCREGGELVGTVGMVEAHPGAVNVVPGKARFTLDLRAPLDRMRDAAERDLLQRFAEIGASRGVSIQASKTHEAGSVAMAPAIVAQIRRAIEAQGLPVHSLPSGAGHDAMALAAVTDVGMIFIRCAGGISHSPAEFASVEDIETGTKILLDVVENFMPVST